MTSFDVLHIRVFLPETITNKWMVRVTIPVGGEIFRARQTGLLYNGYRFVPGVKAAGCGFDHRLPSCTKVKERVDLCLNSTSVSSWPVLAQTLPSITSSFQQAVLMLVRKSTREVVGMVMWT
jgi:hypothetical protein